MPRNLFYLYCLALANYIHTCQHFLFTLYLLILPYSIEINSFHRRCIFHQHFDLRILLQIIFKGKQVGQRVPDGKTEYLTLFATLNDCLLMMLKRFSVSKNLLNIYIVSLAECKASHLAIYFMKQSCYLLFISVMFMIIK